MEAKPKNPTYKYWSKTYKGILKQIQRQQNKPAIAKVVVYPIILSYSSKHSEYRPLKRKIYNNIFRGGKGLDALYSDNYFNVKRSYNGMYTRINFNRNTGKYYLSKTGKEYLNKLRAKKTNKTVTNTVTENNNSANALIAEFMNQKYYEIKCDTIENVSFHNDWNWLMEAVHKITILEEFQEWEFNSLFWEVFCQLDITEIYNQVVLFIEYYNENSA